MRGIDRRLRRLEGQLPAECRRRPFLFFPGLQTYEEALEFAGLADHDGPVFPIRMIGISPNVEQADCL